MAIAFKQLQANDPIPGDVFPFTTEEGRDLTMGDLKMTRVSSPNPGVFTFERRLESSDDPTLPTFRLSFTTNEQLASAVRGFSFFRGDEDFRDLIEEQLEVAEVDGKRWHAKVKARNFFMDSAVLYLSVVITRGKENGDGEVREKTKTSHIFAIERRSVGPKKVDRLDFGCDVRGASWTWKRARLCIAGVKDGRLLLHKEHTYSNKLIEVYLDREDEEFELFRFCTREMTRVSYFRPIGCRPQQAELPGSVDGREKIVTIYDRYQASAELEVRDPNVLPTAKVSVPRRELLRSHPWPDYFEVDALNRIWLCFFKDFRVEVLSPELELLATATIADLPNGHEIATAEVIAMCALRTPLTSDAENVAFVFGITVSTGAAEQTFYYSAEFHSEFL